MKALWRIFMRVFAGIFLWLFVFANAAFPLTAFAATPPPTCQILVNPSSIPVGGSVTVKWTSTNATAGAITNIGNVSPQGSINLLPSSAAVTTYFGAFTGPGGTANCQASVAVNASSGGGTQTTTQTNPVNVGSAISITNTTPTETGSSGLVPCGWGGFDTSGSNDPASSTGCQACNLAQLIQNIITFAIGIAIPIAAALFAYAGVLFFTSADNPGRITKAKQIFKDALVGFLIAVTAWLVINTALSIVFTGSSPFANGQWFTIQCSAGNARPVINKLQNILAGLPIVSGNAGQISPDGTGQSVAQSGGTTDNSNGGTSCNAGFTYDSGSGTCYNPTTDTIQYPTGGVTAGGQVDTSAVTDVLTAACGSDNSDQFSCDALSQGLSSNGKLTDNQQDALGDLCDSGNTSACNALDNALALPSNAPPPAPGQYSSSIASAAQAYKGTNTNIGPIVDNGNKACAYAVNQVLQNAGISQIGDGYSVASMERSLQNGRGVSEGQQYAQAGDIIVFGGMSHVGICQNDGCTQVISNSSSNAAFTSNLPPTTGSRFYRVTN